jgi:hypothetical protein
MSFASIATCYADQALTARVTACCATQDEPDPQTTTFKVLWPVVTATDIEAAYEAALITGNPNPGGDPAVITDQMILSHVQAALETLP